MRRGLFFLTTAAAAFVLTGCNKPKTEEPAMEAHRDTVANQQPSNSSLDYMDRNQPTRDTTMRNTQEPVYSEPPMYYDEPVTPTRSAKSSAARGSGSAAHKSSAGHPSTYTVKSGDNLSKISQKMYGDAGKWKRIWDANKDKVPDKNKLKVGTKLTIP